MGPTVFVPYVLLALALGARWRHRSAVGVPGGGQRTAHVPGLALARLAHEEVPRPRYSAPERTPVVPERRTFWSRMKIWIGGAGLVVCGLWWVLLSAMLFMPDPAPALDGQFTSYSLTLVTASLLVTMLFLVFFRSGLRGPSDPFAPKQLPHERLRDQPYVPRSSSGYGAPGPRSGKKPHLRLVRNTP
ncbi:hypothetical protein [Vitiosangium sp. GDMCC 1.1324]|uniref:hypothetical protein n=1 Tax=Vitiosangium sp. (strain GDMCC 1.1324) TaxID=2138576 RepID=UPI0011B69310|nr:hypothetical protein [Vitiosangium sp. GDMCC 1.1324]